MSGKTRKFAQLSPQKQRQSPAKFVKLTEHDDQEERRKRTASKIAKGHERAKSIVEASAGRRGSGLHGDPSTPVRRRALDTPENNTPVMKMPILANFEEWMKMATDNKINAGNSWNFALIDYFHEMSLLKEGDSINFQKASVTLDGCVKIYTNRVDSVATETGKLLSGLATNKEARSNGQVGEDEDEDGVEEDEEGEARKARRKAVKTSSGSTLVKDFSAIQAKKLDMEFFVDPLFKKTSAEFDEGGAKGLLLNHLCVDREGRIIFDASDASNQISSGEHGDADDEETSESLIDVQALGSKFFPELFEDGNDEAFDQLHICPFLKDFKSDSTVLDIPLLANLPSSIQQQDGDHPLLDQDAYDGNDADQNDAGGIHGVIDVFDDNEDAAFGQVNVDVPSDNRINAFTHPHSPGMNGSGTAIGSENYMGTNLDSDAMYSHFDNLMRKNWSGPSNWKISRLNTNVVAASASTTKKPRKEKEVTTIDFFSRSGRVNTDVIFAPGGASINLPKTQWTSKSRNLLPEDKHFNSESLLRLFLKPRTKIGTRRTIIKNETGTGEDGRFIDMDQNFWAERNEESADPEVPGGYDANFFNDGQDLGGPGCGTMDDDDDENDHFEDAKQEFAATDAADVGDFGSQLQTLGRKVKPEYVNYAKAAKKVDVRVLKENIWDKMDLLSIEDEPKVQIQTTPASTKHVGEVRKFTEIVQSLGDVYPESAMSEISTSFCFICLLHLANEKGLEITADEGMRDLTVRRDETVLAIDSV